MLYGYARVSKQDSNLALQIDALHRYGVDRIYEEKISGAKIDRAQLELLLAALRPGDTLVVWKLDRLGRSMKQLVNLMEDFEQRSINFVSLTESFDTTTPAGRMCFNIFCAVAQMERDLARERTMAGLQAARERGRKGGRPAKDRLVVETALRMYATGDFTVEEIMRASQIGRATFYKYLRLQKERLEDEQARINAREA